jgi:phosphotransferase system enzyme I (PtsI)
MGAEIRLSGHPSAPGLARGPVFRLSRAPTASTRVASGDPLMEEGALKAALRAATHDLSSLAETAEGDAAGIVAFQVAILEDEALSEPAFAGIELGLPADQAWLRAMGEEIAGYEAADDEYFRARAADLIDVRDRVLAHLTGVGTAAIPRGAVVAGEDLTPSAFLAADWSAGGGIALAKGSPSSHVAMLARARGVPMVVGLGSVPDTGAIALIDGGRGVVVFDPAEETAQGFDGAQAAARAAEREAEMYRNRPAVSADGVAVKVLINVADPAELDTLDPAICDGIGLTRTEFLFHGDGPLPDSLLQYKIYRRLVDWADGRPVTIRTLDAGGDKPIPGLTIDGESNPFLGVRGIRLSLARVEVFRVQLRALACAAVHGPLKVMLPMVAVPAELEAARALLDSVCAELEQAGVPHRKPDLGIMVEVPATALTAGQFNAAFYSIGSNDLTQYTMAAARDITDVAGLNDTRNPAVLHLIRETVQRGDKRGVEVSLCGDAAADPAVLPDLLATGLRVVSVAPVAVGRVKASIAKMTLRAADGE